MTHSCEHNLRSWFVKEEECRYRDKAGFCWRVLFIFKVVKMSIFINRGVKRLIEFIGVCDIFASKENLDPGCSLYLDHDGQRFTDGKRICGRG